MKKQQQLLLEYKLSNKETNNFKLLQVTLNGIFKEQLDKNTLNFQPSRTDNSK